LPDVNLIRLYAADRGVRARSLATG
jgi:hypothetical protein